MNHKEVLALIASLPAGLEEELDDILSDLDEDSSPEIINSDPPLMISGLGREIIEHSEGVTYEIQAFLINGAVFVRNFSYDSWDYHDLSDLIPAQQETKIVYREIR